MKSFFSEPEINASLQQVFIKLGLTQKLVMSLSGTYHVVSCTNPSGVDYMVKVRRKTDPLVLKAFTKEARINQYLSAARPPFTVPHTVYFYERLQPEVLVYSSVIGEALGWYYFYTGAVQVRTLGASSIINALTYLADHTSDIASQAGLPMVTPTESIKRVQAYRNTALASGLPINIYTQCENVVTAFAATWLKHPVLVHGDLNPKNILFTPAGELGLIDWSDAHLNNRYYDLAFLWLTLWRTPDVQNEIVKLVRENSQTFWQQVLFWLPKYYGIIHDASAALTTEFAAGHIPEQAKTDNLALAAAAKTYYQNRLSDFVKLAQ